jgi:hypothetical protein
VANSQAVCTSFKVEILNGIHAFGTTVTRGATTKDTFKAALFLASASLGAATTAYSATGEVSGTNYTAGGVTVTNANAPASSAMTTPHLQQHHPPNPQSQSSRQSLNHLVILLFKM